MLWNASANTHGAQLADFARLTNLGKILDDILNTVGGRGEGKRGRGRAGWGGARGGEGTSAFPFLDIAGNHRVLSCGPARAGQLITGLVKQI